MLLGQPRHDCQKASAEVKAIAVQVLLCGHCGNPDCRLKPRRGARAASPGSIDASEQQMIQFFRKYMKSGFGVAMAIGFVVLLGLAFAAGDIANNGGFGGVAGGDRVATVGKQALSTSQLSQAATTALENAKQQDPRLTMKAFIAAGGLEQILEEMLGRTALGEFGKQVGIVASPRLVDSEIAKIQAFKGPDGKFSDAAFKQALRQRGISEDTVRGDFEQGLVGRQMILPAGFGAIAPRELTVRYAALLREQRVGAIALLPSAAFAPRTPPSDADLQAYYKKNTNSFIRPERRILRFAAFGDSALKNLAPPSDAEIAARYQRDKAQYAAQETRRIAQLILPTEAAAQAIVAEVSKGKRLEAAAAEKGLSAANLGALTREALSGQASQAVADAVFASASGKLAAPAKSALGWHVMRIDGIDRKTERTLEQVRAELSGQIATEKRRAALNDLSARLEEEFDEGGNLADAAKELGLTLQQTPPLTADGQVYGQPGATAPPALARVIQTAFAMERENQPQLAEVETGKTFLIYDVSAITTSAPAPLAEIKGDVATMLLLEKGTTGAKAAAEKVLAAVRKGSELSAAMTSLNMPPLPVQEVNMNRQQLQAAQQQVPPPLQLLFSMAKGTVKTLAAPNNRGWYVVALKDIQPAKDVPPEQQIVQFQRELGGLAGREYGELLMRAIRKEVGVTRNDSAISAVRNQLTGAN